MVQIKGRYYARWTVDGKRVYGEPRDSFDLADRDRVSRKPASEPVRRSEIPTLQQWAHDCQTGDYGQSKATTTLDTQETIRLTYIEGKAIGKEKLSKLTRSKLQAFIDSIDRSPSYKRRIAAFVSKILSIAVQEGLIPANPMKGLKLPDVEERENRTLSPEEAMKLLNPQTRTDAIMLVAMHTGMRRSELLRLEWRHIGKDMVKVPGTKNQKSKGSVPLTPEAKEAIDAQPKRSKYIFTTESGAQIISRNLSRDYSARKKTIGLPAETRLQDLRGSYVSLLIEQGVDPRTVMDLARHSDLRTTMKAYARSREAVRIEAVEKLRGAMGLEKKVNEN